MEVINAAPATGLAIVKVMMTVEEAIRVRRSVRTYQDTAVAPEVMEFVKNYIGNLHQALPGCRCRLVLLERKLDGKVGTYGAIRNAGYFLAVVHSKDSDLEAINAGIVGERLVLELTRRGIGTVWLGGTFSRGTVGKMVKPAPDETVDVVIAFGVPADKESFTSRMMASMFKARSRKPFQELFDIRSRSAFRPGLKLMHLAPSASNRQEWRVTETLWDIAPGMGRIDFFTADMNRFAALDLGIGIAHFLVDAPAGHLAVVPDGAGMDPLSHYHITYVAE